MRASALCSALLCAAVLPGAAAAQTFRGGPTPPPFPYGPAAQGPSTSHSSEAEADLRGRFGVELAARLIRSDDAEARLHGVERAAAESSSQAMTLLIRALDAGGAARLDARALVAVARGLEPYAAQAEARAALQNIVASPTASRLRSSSRPEALPDSELDRGRIDVARATAALALAQSVDSHAREALWSLARSAGTGQPYAAQAMLALPFSTPGSLATVGMPSAASLHLLAELGDLRSLDAVRAAAKSADASTRAAALAAMGDLGDLRGLEAARAAVSDVEPTVREAAAHALVLLGAPEAPRAVEGLIGSDATALAGVRLAELCEDDGVVRALAARLAATSDLETRRAAIVALGRSSRASAIPVLSGMTADPWVGGDAAAALARSPRAEAEAPIEAMLASRADPALRRLGVRASVLRAVVRGRTVKGAEETIESLARSRDPNDRALGAAARVLVGSGDPTLALQDPEPRVRAAVATASLAHDGYARELVVHLASERDDRARIALSAGLLHGEADGVTTSALLDRAESGEPDAPLAAMAFVIRVGKDHEGEVLALLGSRDPLVRAHVARGLAASSAKNAIGRLSSAYTYEPDTSVRLALVLSAAARTQDEGSPERRAILSLAAHLDPDRLVRAAAARALACLPASLEPARIRELAWLRLTTPQGKPPAEPMAAAVVRADGVAIPFVFDFDGYALVPVPPGDTRLVLAPKLPAYEALSR